MAINKTINKSTKTHGAMRNCIEYVLKDQKITDGYVYVTGPYNFDDITWDNVYRSFLDEKRLWDKDSGRMYNHNIISFHRDEAITPSEALEFGKCFVEKWFPDNQTLISVHQDKDHVHIHLVTNTVSFVDGHKLHNSRKDLERMKNLTNEMCKERGLTVAEKGRHYDGTEMDQGEIIAWSKDKYKLVNNENKDSYLVDCAIAVSEVMEDCCSRDEFMEKMLERNWKVVWNERRKHITFENDSGKRVRDSNISNSFSMNISKEELDGEFERQKEMRIARTKAERERAAEQEKQLDKYYAEVSAAINGRTSGEAVGSTETCDGGERQPSGTRGGNKTEALIENIRAEIVDNRAKNRDVRDTENQSAAFEKQSILDAAERRAQEQARIDAEERARESWRRDCDFEEPCL